MKIKAQQKLIDALKESISFFKTAKPSMIIWTHPGEPNDLIPVCHHLEPVIKKLVLEHAEEELSEAQRKIQMMKGLPDVN
jgi:hypothetical protein